MYSITTGTQHIIYTAIAVVVYMNGKHEQLTAKGLVSQLHTYKIRDFRLVYIREYCYCNHRYYHSFGSMEQDRFENFTVDDSNYSYTMYVTLVPRFWKFVKNIKRLLFHFGCICNREFSIHLHTI